MKKFKITNPYASVTELMGNPDNHYKTNLHTHSTYSDANEPLSVMVKGAYDQGYDFLAFADHGVTGVEWDESPFFHPLYLYQPLLGYKFEHLTTEEYEAIKNGT